MHIGAFGRGDSLWNRSFSHISDLCDHDLDWPWVWSYSIPSCITHRPLPTYQITFISEKLFVDGETDGCTNRRTLRLAFRSTLEEST